MISMALNLTGISIPSFIEGCRNIIAHMTGNPAFAAPPVAMLQVTAGVDQLEQTYQLGLNGDHASKNLQKIQQRQVNAIMQALKGYVSSVSTTEAMALSSGMSIRRSPEPHSALTPPQDVRGKLTGNAGEAEVAWKGVRNRSSYNVYQTTDLADISNPGKWTLRGQTGKRKFTADGLTVGTKYGFIIVAIGSGSTKSAPSDPAILTAA